MIWSTPVKQVMSLSRNVGPADQQMSIADQDPPSIPVGVQQARASQDHRGNQQLVQWLSVQADHMAGSLQQNVRALMVRATSPMPSDGRHEDEVATTSSTSSTRQESQW